MLRNFPRRQAIGVLIVAAFFVVMITLGVSHLSPADDSAPKTSSFSPYVTKEGGLSLPTDYREKFVHLGTWAVAPKPDKPVHQIHSVYTRPDDIEAYRRDGKFRDGTVLVKEITDVASDKMTTGQSSWSTKVKIWFLMVKDDKDRFPKNPLWAEGWGWALFEAKDPKKNVATAFSTDCKTCHIPAKNDGWVYVRGYPILAKPIPPK